MSLLTCPATAVFTCSADAVLLTQTLVIFNPSTCKVVTLCGSILHLPQTYSEGPASAAPFQRPRSLTHLHPLLPSLLSSSACTHTLCSAFYITSFVFEQRSWIFMLLNPSGPGIMFHTKPTPQNYFLMATTKRSSHFKKCNGSQLDGIWNQIKGKLLGTPVRDLINQFIWSGKTHPKCGWHLPVAAQIKEVKEAERVVLLLPACHCPPQPGYLPCCCCSYCLRFPFLSQYLQACTCGRAHGVCPMDSWLRMKKTREWFTDHPKCSAGITQKHSQLLSGTARKGSLVKGNLLSGELWTVHMVGHLAWFGWMVRDMEDPYMKDKQ